MIGRNISKYRRDCGLSQQDLADFVGVSRGSVAAWEVDRTNPTFSNLRRISEILNVSIQQLTGEIVEQPSANLKRVPVKVLGTTHAGEPLEMHDDEDAELAYIPEEVARYHPRAFGLRVLGRCMNNVVPEGAVAIIDPDESARVGDVVCVATKEGESVLRRYYPGSGVVMLSPDSTDEYSDMFIKHEEDATDRILGVMVWFHAPGDMSK